MALKGQGDPRWIVTSREDGQNVNAWHWTETDLTSWAKERLRSILAGITLENDKFVGSTTTVSHVEGDVIVNTRKQKTIVLYELDVTMKWEGQMTSGLKGSGTIQLPYISDERDPDDFEVRVTISDGNSREADDMKDHVRSRSIVVLKQKIPKFIEELKQTAFEKTKLQLKQEGAVNKLDKLETLVQAGAAPALTVPVSAPAAPVPAAPVSAAPAVVPAAAPAKPASTTATPASATAAAAPKAKASSPTSFSLTEKFMCRPMDLFECFLEQNRVRAYAGSDATISRAPGGKFSLFGGAVQGEIVEVEPASLIKQKWRFSNWPEGVYSTVTFKFEEKNGKTVLKLEQTGLPSEDKDRTEQGWRNNFFVRIKGVFGFGGLS
eukprot:TRINITY_DN7948_c0_g1_i1.p1 TRINITY_DN7948_c0_g1~~TRINITY_DN7948_c0_g1_i1.p1  ORF type:complete len:379 (-),score=151.41 TRINITY_DN7948_c0_g1_i1:390-1526(-)